MAKQSIRDYLIDLTDVLEEAYEDAEKFDDRQNPNKAAGARVRKALLKVRNGCQILRKEITDRKNEI